jgi:hypothetical protein
LCGSACLNNVTLKHLLETAAYTVVVRGRINTTFANISVAAWLLPHGHVPSACSTAHFRLSRPPSGTACVVSCFTISVPVEGSDELKLIEVLRMNILVTTYSALKWLIRVFRFWGRTL